MSGDRGTGRFLSIVPLLFMAALGFVLLAFVATAKTQVGYERFQVDRLEAQAGMLHALVEDFVAVGLPIRFFQSLMHADSELGRFSGFVSGGEGEDALGVVVTDASGEVLIDNGQTRDRRIPLPENAEAMVEEVLETGDLSPRFWRLRAHDDAAYRYLYPLFDSQELQGYLRVSLPREQVNTPVEAAFAHTVWIVPGLLALFAFLAWRLVDRHWAMVWIYALLFTAMTVAVTWPMVKVLTAGASVKTEAMFHALSGRLDAARRAGMKLSDVDGLNAIFQDYMRQDEQIGSIALLEQGGRIVAHSDHGKVGRTWARDSDDIVYLADFGDDQALRMHLAVALPSDVVLHSVLRGLKDFIALYVSTALLAYVLMRVAVSLRRANRISPMDRGHDREHGRDVGRMVGIRLGLIGPVWVFGVMCDGFLTPLLPAYAQELAAFSAYPETAAAWPFSLFFFSFLFAMVPGARWSRSGHVQPVLMAGGWLMFAGFVLLWLRTDFESLMVARTVSGFGQGLLFIGVQSYIQLTTPPTQRQRGMGVIVFAFNVGFLAGAAIGALLASLYHLEWVLRIAAAVAVLLVFYVWWLIPEPPVAGVESKGRGGSVWAPFRDGRFLKGLLLVGVSSKAVVGGVVMFGLPLLALSQAYGEEDVGQLLMLFALAMMLSNRFATRITDRLGRAEPVLSLGLLLMAVAVAGLGYTGLQEDRTVGVALMVAGVLLLGLSQGMVSAPVMTYVQSTASARALGRIALGAQYRSLERLGHVSGPPLVSLFIVLSGGDVAESMLWFAGLLLACAVLFALGSTRVR